MDKLGALAFTFFIITFTLPAQEGRLPYYFQLNGNLQLSIPLEAFADKLDDNGFGGGGLLLFQLGRGKPMFAGIELSALTYDRERLDFTEIQDGQAIDFRLETNNNFFLGHALLRFKPFTGSNLQPYLDGMLGFKRMYTRTRLIELLPGEDEVLETDTDRSDSAFSYGLAGGLQIRVAYQPDILIDLRCAYLPGANATYLVRKEDVPDNLQDPLEAFEEVTSPTTLLLPQLGVTFQFSSRDFQEEAPEDH